MLLITSFGRRLAALFVVGLVGMAQAQAQAFLLTDAQTYLKERTTDPFKPIREPVGDYVDLYPAMRQWTLLFEKDGVKRKVKCKDIWGSCTKACCSASTMKGPSLCG